MNRFLRCNICWKYWYAPDDGEDDTYYNSDAKKESEFHTGEPVCVEVGCLQFAPDWEEFYVDDRQFAIWLAADEDPEDWDESKYSKHVYEHGERRFLVVTEEEADQIWKEQIESSLEGIVLCQIPEPYRDYFDVKGWIEDVMEQGDRDQDLSRGEWWDEVRVWSTGEYYYVYKG